MKKFLAKYTEIINAYRNGVLGEEQKTLHDILSESNETDILEKMSISEMRSLSDMSTGLLKKMFSNRVDKKIHDVKKMKNLENELTELGIKKYCSENIPNEDLARKLGLEVIYCEPDELPTDVEATLSPPKDKEHLGTIRVLENTNVTKFSYIHEIIHYLKDVGEGNVVSKTFTRKKRGQTDSIGEQDINYLTAATIMPFERVSRILSNYEKLSHDEEKELITHMAQEYGQTEDAVSRRIIEVRDLVDYNCYVGQEN